MAKSKSNTKSLSSQAEIKELMQILRDNKMNPQYREMSHLVNYIDTMEKQLDNVFGELNSVKRQLDEIKDKQHPLRKACLKIAKSMETELNEAKEKLNDVKASVIEGAKSAVSAFKENGLSALNSVMNFFNVTDSLNSFRRSIDKSIASSEKSIVQIDKISHELHAVGSHTRNIGRAVIGKETQHDTKENGKITKIVQAPFRANTAALAGIGRAVSLMLDKLEHLDKTVEQNSTKGTDQEKTSILKSVTAFKAFQKAQKAEKAPEVTNSKSKKQETSL